jgi:predicted O-methyltransferase YrrM
MQYPNSDYPMSIDKEQIYQAIQRTLFGPTAGRIDVMHVAEITAAIESADYYTTHMLATPNYDDKDALLVAMVNQAPENGLFLEFGVAAGQTLNLIASLKPDKTVYGFDSFKGLPDNWRRHWRKGSFAQTSLPKILDNCELIVGLFENTLPAFIHKKREPIAFIHIDCDLYASTKTALTHCAPYIGPGTIILFDEFFNYAGWKQHEYRAWQEFCHDHNIKAHPIGFVSADMQVRFRVE